MSGVASFVCVLTVLTVLPVRRLPRGPLGAAPVRPRTAQRKQSRPRPAAPDATPDGRLASSSGAASSAPHPSPGALARVINVGASTGPRPLRRRHPPARRAAPRRGTFYVAGTGAGLAALRLVGLAILPWSWVLAPFWVAGTAMFVGRFLVDLHEVL
jgi:hypothetical protein